MKAMGACMTLDVEMVRCVTMAAMETIRKHDASAAVQDVQEKLASLGYLGTKQVTGTFDDATIAALKAFCKDSGFPPRDEVDDKVWALLLDATFRLGDRTLYLRMPYFHGNDVAELQQALDALGFATSTDGMFGAHTELALRLFQMNMGLPSDGIAGSFTFRAIANLHHSWEGKPGPQAAKHVGFARAASVLEHNALCLFGTDEFTRSVAARMSNLALATNPASKIVSAENLLVAPDNEMFLVHIVADEAQKSDKVPFVLYESEETLPLRLAAAFAAASQVPPRLAICLPGTQWADAGVGRSAQHYAITLLDAICSALASDAQ